MESPPKTCQFVIFPVNKRAYSVWSFNVRRDNLEFIKGISADFFSYLGTIHGDKTDGDDGAHAAIALRLAYHHGVETLLSLLAGTLQAPEAIVAWMGKCRTSDLREIVEDISNKNQSLLRLLGVKEVSWRGLSQIISVDIDLSASLR